METKEQIDAAPPSLIIEFLQQNIQAVAKHLQFYKILSKGFIDYNLQNR
jgi:hypothetical protein